MPSSSPAAADYRYSAETFGVFETVFVMVQDEAEEMESEGDRLLEATWWLEERLAMDPLVAEVTSGISSADENYFRNQVLPLSLLLIDDQHFEDELRQLEEPNWLVNRSESLARRLAGPTGGIEGILLQSDPFGFARPILAAASSTDDLPVDTMTGSFLSQEHRSTLLLVEPVASELDSESGSRLAQRLEQLSSQLALEFGDGLRVYAIGGPIYAANDEDLLRGDLEKTLATSGVLCLGLLLLAFGGWRAPLAAMASVVAALLYTAGLLSALVMLGVVAPISAASLGFAAVLVGLGLDYCIHGATRFREALEAGESELGALVSTVAATGPAILASAMTTAVAFATLLAASLPPLRELGALVVLGMGMMLLASVAVGGGLMVALHRKPQPASADAVESAERSAQTGTVLWRLLGQRLEGAVEGAARRRSWVVALALLISLIAAFGLPRLSIDADLRALRPSDHPTEVAEEAIAEAFDIGFDTGTVLVPGATLEQALDRARLVAPILRQSLPLASEVTSPSDWLVGSSADRLERLRQSKLAEQLSDVERVFEARGLVVTGFAPAIEALRSLAQGELPSGNAATPDDSEKPNRPQWIERQLYTSSDGAVVGIDLRLADEDHFDIFDQPAVRRQLSQLAPGWRLASPARVGRELRALATSDLSRLALLGGTVVTLIVMLSLRFRLLAGLISLTPVTLGCLWILGGWGWIDGRLDLFSLSVLPILLGIGVDDGLHAVHGADLASSERPLLGSVRRISRAVTLTTMTTAVGFGSLVLSSVPGLRRGGVLVALGVVFCLLATLFVLPALERRSQARRDFP